MPAKLYNLARMTTATAGTGTITLGSAVAGFLSFASAGVSDGDTITYAIEDGSNSEIGRGVYTASGTTLSRSVLKSTNSNNPIHLSGTAAAQVIITAAAEDFVAAVRQSYDGCTLINGTITTSVTSNILTVAVKTLAGNDPSANDPVLIAFRSTTAGTGDYTLVEVTSALSMTTHATGATLGTANSVPFRLWVCAFNNAGTVVLALWQSVTGGSTPTALASLDETSTQSTTGISGSATSAGVFYTPNGTSLTSKAFRIIGYLDYGGTGLTTAGSYGSNPTKIQLFGPGVRKPGDLVQVVQMTTTTPATSTNTSFADSTLTLNISPTSAPNLVRAGFSGMGRMDGTSNGSLILQLCRGTTNVGFAGFLNTVSAGNNVHAPFAVGGYIDAPGTTSSTKYVVRLRSQNGNLVSFPEFDIASLAYLCAEEIMA
jgi:hypothetical protein